MMLNITIIQETVGYRDAIKLLIVVYGKSWRVVWLTMLSKDKHLGDITSGTGICFDLLLHLFLRNNILKFAVNSVVNWYTVSLTNLTELLQSVAEMVFFKMEVTLCIYRVQVLFDNYFCLDKPIYYTPGIHTPTIYSCTW